MKTIRIKVIEKHYKQLKKAAKSWGYRSVNNYVSVQIFKQIKRAE